MPNGEKKGITVRIDADLHAEVSQYLRDHSMTMAEFVSLALDDELHPKNQMKEGNTMANTRTIAVQVPEDGILHKGRIRKLMPIECWRLQGYADEQFNKAAALGLKDGHLYKMAGNSVSVPVISAIGQKIKAVNEKYEIVR